MGRQVDACYHCPGRSTVSCRWVPCPAHSHLSDTRDDLCSLSTERCCCSLSEFVCRPILGLAPGCHCFHAEAPVMIAHRPSLLFLFFSILGLQRGWTECSYYRQALCKLSMSAMHHILRLHVVWCFQQLSIVGIIHAYQLFVLTKLAEHAEVQLGSLLYA